MKKFLFIFLSVFFVTCFFGLQKAKADAHDIVINEVMFSPDNESTGEFIELYNNNQTDSVDLSSWTFKDNGATRDILKEFTKYSFGQSAGMVIKPNSFAIILDSQYNHEYDNYFLSHNQANNIFLTTNDLTLGNGLATTDNISLYVDAISSNVIDFIDWKPENGVKKYSYERDIFDNTWDKSEYEGGTPGSYNSGLQPKLLSPVNLGTIETGQTINFSWEIKSDFDYRVIISKNQDLSDPISGSADLEEGTYYWQVIVKNDYCDVPSEVWSFTISQPVYSDAIIINEIMPNPSGDQAAGEWIELYNNSEEEVNLRGWALADSKGDTNKYTIEGDLIITPHGYIIIFRSQSKIVLNDDSDSAILYQPDGIPLYTVQEYTSAKDDISWARGSDGKWEWTATPTPQAENKITSPAVETASSVSISNQPADSTIYEIPTGDFKNYVDRWVKIEGTVTETSGNIFYIDDGTGRAKVYIQDSAGISKPPMHKGDTFEIIGIVDLYGADNWRVLPQNQDGVKLTSVAVKTITVASSTKKTTTSTKTTDSNTTSTPEKAVLAENTNTIGSDNKQNSDSTQPVWLEVVESLIGLATIALISLIIATRRKNKSKIIGGHFGDDET